MPEMAQIRKVRSAGCVVRLFQLAETKVIESLETEVIE